MNYFQSLVKKLAISVVGICLWFSSANAHYKGPSDSGLDGTKTTVAVWRVLESNLYKVQGVYGTGPIWTPVDITQIAIENVIDFPILATSRNVSATIRAAVTWLSEDIATLRNNLRVSVYDSTLGTWSTPTTVSSNTADEIVRSDYLITISDDGETISITWIAYFIGIAQNVLRSSISIDGGANWTTSNIANLGSSF